MKHDSAEWASPGCWLLLVGIIFVAIIGMKMVPAVHRVLHDQEGDRRA